MTPELLNRLRAEVQQERDAIIAELKTHGADPYSEKIDRIEGIDANFADSAAANAERTEILAMVENLRERLHNADAALARMDAGTFGVCEQCGNDIADARMEALPDAALCINCAARQ